MYTFGNSIGTPFQNAYKSNGNVTNMNISILAKSTLSILATQIKQNLCAISVQFQKCQYLLGFTRFFELRSTHVLGRFQGTPNILNFGHSQNAIKTNEKVRKPSTYDLQHGEIFNIPYALKGFLNSAQRTFWVASKAPQNPVFRSFTKCNKTDEKLRKPSNVNLRNDPIFNIPLVL